MESDVNSKLKRKLDHFSVGDLVRIAEELRMDTYPIGPPTGTTSPAWGDFLAANRIYLSREEIAMLAEKYPVLPAPRPTGPAKPELAASLRGHMMTTGFTPEMRDFVNDLLTKAGYGSSPSRW